MSWSVQHESRKLALQESYGKELEADHAVMPWLIMHAGSKRTAYVRTRGKPYHEELPIFGANKKEAKFADGVHRASPFETGHQRDVHRHD